MTFFGRRNAHVPRRVGGGEDDWPVIDARRVPLETAKTLMSEAGKYLESQQKGMDSLRARLLDVARQCTTLAALAGGALGITATGSATIAASYPWQVAGGVSAACWITAAFIAAVSMFPGGWGYAGRPVREWWEPSLIEDDEDPPQSTGTLLAMAKSSEDLIARNERREARMARNLKIALGLYIGALPVAVATGVLVRLMAGPPAEPPAGYFFF